MLGDPNSLSISGKDIIKMIFSHSMYLVTLGVVMMVDTQQVVIGILRVSGDLKMMMALFHNSKFHTIDQLFKINFWKFFIFLGLYKN